MMGLHCFLTPIVFLKILGEQSCIVKWNFANYVLENNNLAKNEYLISTRTSELHVLLNFGTNQAVKELKNQNKV